MSATKHHPTTPAAKYAKTSRKDAGGRCVYTRSGKDYVRRKCADGTIKYRQANKGKSFVGGQLQLFQRLKDRKQAITHHDSMPAIKQQHDSIKDINSHFNNVMNYYDEKIKENRLEKDDDVLKKRLNVKYAYDHLLSSIAYLHHSLRKKKNLNTKP